MHFQWVTGRYNSLHATRRFGFRSQIIRGGHVAHQAPNAHGTLEEEANVIRRGAAALFKGTFELLLAVKAVPVDPKLAELQATLAKRLSDADATDGSLRVKISSGDGTAVGRPA